MKISNILLLQFKYDLRGNELTDITNTLVNVFVISVDILNR